MFCDDELVRHRTETVHQALLSLGAEPRSDSELTAKYAHGVADPTYVLPEDVAHTLFAVDFVYKRTLYPEIVSDAMRIVANRLKRQYEHLSWTAIWNVVRFYAPTALKVQCLLMAAYEV